MRNLFHFLLRLRQLGEKKPRWEKQDGKEYNTWVENWLEYRNLSRKDWQIVKLPLWLLFAFVPLLRIWHHCPYKLQTIPCAKCKRIFTTCHKAKKRQIKRWIDNWHCSQHSMVHPSSPINVTIDYIRSNIWWFNQYNTSYRFVTNYRKKKTLHDVTYMTRKKKLNDTKH